MKFRLLAAAVLVCATGSLMSMLPEMKYCNKLKFIFNSQYEIAAYSIDSDFTIAKNALTRKNLLGLAPFKNVNIKYYVEQVYSQSKSIRAILTLENKEFLSKVSPVFVEDKLVYCLLTLRPVDNLI